MRFLALANGSVFPGAPTTTTSTGTLLIRDTLVEGTYDTLSAAEAAAGRPVETVDITGMTVLPGLIDCHVHLFFTGAIDAMTNWRSDTEGAAERSVAHLRAGVTTVRDLGGPTPEIFQVRDDIAAGRLPGPRVLAAGPIVTVPDGHGCFIGEVVRDRVELVEAMRRLADSGADCVKIAVSGGVSTPTSDLFAVQFSESDLGAAVETAHELGLRVAGHASNPEAIRIAASVGIDSVEHAVMVDDAAIEALVHGTTTVVPTLAATNKPLSFLEDERIPQFIRDKGRITLPAHRESIKRVVAAGVPMAGGTDAGTTQVAHGLAAMEADQLVGCGLTNAEALAAVTSHSAQLLGLADELGTLEPGKLADAVVVAGNPLDDIGCLKDVRLVVKDGAVVHRATG